MKHLSSFFWASMIPTPWVMGLAKLGKVGDAPRAPGTWGSVLGILWYATVFTSVHGLAYLFLMASVLYFAAGICEEASIRLGRKDPGEVILDEFVPFCFIAVESYFAVVHPAILVLLGLGLFRLLDIWKPYPISRLDKIEGGWGILLDDVAAALITCFALHVLLATGWLERLLSGI